jgi:hypothetical protein
MTARTAEAMAVASANRADMAISHRRRRKRAPISPYRRLANMATVGRLRRLCLARGLGAMAGTTPGVAATATGAEIGIAIAGTGATGIATALRWCLAWAF